MDTFLEFKKTLSKTKQSKLDPLLTARYSDPYQ